MLYRIAVIANQGDVSSGSLGPTEPTALPLKPPVLVSIGKELEQRVRL